MNPTFGHQPKRYAYLVLRTSVGSRIRPTGYNRQVGLPNQRFRRLVACWVFNPNLPVVSLFPAFHYSTARRDNEVRLFFWINIEYSNHTQTGRLKTFQTRPVCDASWLTTPKVPPKSPTPRQTQSPARPEQKRMVEHKAADVRAPGVVHLHRAQQRGISGQHKQRRHRRKARHQNIHLPVIRRRDAQRQHHRRHNRLGRGRLRIKQHAGKEKRHRQKPRIIAHQRGWRIFSPHPNAHSQKCRPATPTPSTHTQAAMPDLKVLVSKSLPVLEPAKKSQSAWQ